MTGGYIIKKTVKILFLSACLIFFMAAWYLLFVSSFYLEKGLLLFEMKRWDEAEQCYIKALAASPFYPEVLAGYADLLINKRRGAPDPGDALLKKAETLYEKAAKIAPLWPGYPLRLGECKAREFMKAVKNKDTAKAEELADKMCQYFNAAIGLDPEGFWIIYPAVYSNLAAWDYLDPLQRQVLLDHIKRFLDMKPGATKDVVPRVWAKTRDSNALRYVVPLILHPQRYLYKFILDNGIWDMRSEQARRVEYFRRKFADDKYRKEKGDKNALLNEIRALEKPWKDRFPGCRWRGLRANQKGLRSRGGKITYRGTICAVLDISPGDVVIRLRMKAVPLGDMWPYAVVELDGRDIGGALVTKDEWADYDFRTRTNGGVQVLSVTFINFKKDDTVKMSLFVSDVKLIYPAEGKI